MSANRTIQIHWYATVCGKPIYIYIYRFATNSCIPMYLNCSVCRHFLYTPYSHYHLFYFILISVTLITTAF